MIRHDPIYLIGQASGAVVYSRNIVIGLKPPQGPPRNSLTVGPGGRDGSNLQQDIRYQPGLRIVIVRASGSSDEGTIWISKVPGGSSAGIFSGHSIRHGNPL